MNYILQTKMSSSINLNEKLFFSRSSLFLRFVKWESFIVVMSFSVEQIQHSAVNYRDFLLLLCEDDLDFFDILLEILLVDMLDKILTNLVT